MTDNAKKFMELLINEYKRTNVNSFDIDFYMKFDNHEEVINELKSKDLVKVKPNINGTIFINDEKLNV